MTVNSVVLWSQKLSKCIDGEKKNWYDLYMNTYISVPFKMCGFILIILKYENSLKCTQSNDVEILIAF